jgi:hypothetical protein
MPILSSRVAASTARAIANVHHAQPGEARTTPADRCRILKQKSAKSKASINSRLTAMRRQNRLDSNPSGSTNLARLRVNAFSELQVVDT